MRLTSLIIASTIGFSGAVQASEFYHQASPGELEFTASLNSEYSSSSFSNGADSEGIDLILGFQIEKALGEKWAAGAWFGYGYGEGEEFNVDRDSDGLEDIELYVKSFLPTASGSIRYGFTLTAALEDKEIEQDGYSNRFSGGIGSRLYLGYEHNSSPHVLGFRISQEIGLEDRLEVSDTGGQIEVSGEEEFQVAFYYERPKKDAGFWGGQFSYTLTSDREANGVTSEIMSPILRWHIYRPTPLGSNILVPQLGFGISTADNVNGAELDEYLEAQFNVAYRF